MIARTASGKDIHGCLEANAATKNYSGAQESFSGDYFVCTEGGAMEFTIRRLTPTECARLQGFPDDWCDDLGSDPTGEEIDRWLEVFEDNRRVIGGKVVKSRKQVANWLKSPHSDSAEYKMWGNGVALPCVDYVMAGIAYWADKEIKDERQQEHQVTIEEWIKGLK